MSYAYDDQVKDKLGLPTYHALMNAVDTAVISQTVMRDLARGLDPRVGGGHIHRMDARGRCDRRELKEILSDWYNRGGLLRMSSGEALAKLAAIFLDLDVTIEPHSPQHQPSVFAPSLTEIPDITSPFQAISSPSTSHVPVPANTNTNTKTYTKTKTKTKTNTNTNTYTKTNTKTNINKPVSIQPGTNVPYISTVAKKPSQPAPPSPPKRGPKRRRAFLVANTYQDIDEHILKTLPGTEKSIELVDKALSKHGFQSTTIVDQSFEKMLAELKAWKTDAFKDEIPDALFFYFCGHGGKYSVCFMIQCI